MPTPEKFPLAEGVTDLPPGWIASLVTFLEHHGPAPARPAPPAGLALPLESPAEVAAYRDLYRRVGEDLLWMSRTIMTDAELAEWLGRPTTAIRFPMRGSERIGLLELDRSVTGETEIVSFGVVPEEVGSGAARFMMDTLLADEFAAGQKRVWLHTCSFDHPAAIRFYQRHGFRPYKFAVEIVEDPRLSGHLPKHAAPQVPLIERR